MGNLINKTIGEFKVQAFYQGKFMGSRKSQSLSVWTKKQRSWCGRCEGGADTPLSSPKTCATIKLILRKVSIFTDKPELLSQQLEKGAFLWGI